MTMNDLHEALKGLDDESPNAEFFKAAKVLKAVQAAGNLDLDDLTEDELRVVDELQYLDTREDA